MLLRKFPPFSGSNLLISDDGINGLVLNPGKAFRHLKFNDSNLYAESGVMLGRIVRESIKRNLSGLESLIGVPGTLGGALVMNAGAFGGEISNFLKSVKIMNMKGEIKSYGTYEELMLKSKEFKKLATSLAV